MLTLDELEHTLGSVLFVTTMLLSMFCFSLNTSLLTFVLKPIIKYLGAEEVVLSEDLDLTSNVCMEAHHCVSLQFRCLLLAIRVTVHTHKLCAYIIQAKHPFP